MERPSGLRGGVALFSNAVQATKTTNTEHQAHMDDVSDDRSGGILKRIKKVSSGNQVVKLSSGRVIQRVGKGRDLRRLIDSDDNQGGNSRNQDDGRWKHDKFDGPACTGSNPGTYAVFLRGLPFNTDNTTLKKYAREFNSLLGVRVEGATAEMTFSRQDQAKAAVEVFNSRPIRGTLVKACLVNEKTSLGMQHDRAVRALANEDDPMDGSNTAPSRRIVINSRASTGSGRKSMRGFSTREVSSSSSSGVFSRLKKPRF
eukprot:CAMPEP_0115012248 /NCGR_PEP_ID=MMETSP0216-20121206/24601_1 /TAXON_ID=223996 /ORGANISM="Protocruzia adherens, Strain Boccale" /LENGTH=257 /DNA_ID=CAMNT_0002381223 /DNA_START=374 /DNA_END=1147 /DNA_ORIENTATION=-